MRVCYVDRFIAYPTQIYNHLQQLALQQNHEVYFIGPITNNQESISSKYGKYVIQTWSKNNFIRKLLKQFKKLNPDLIHISFEFRTFGSLQSVIKFPILMFLLRLTNTKIILSIHSILIYKDNQSWKIDEKIPMSLPKNIFKLIIKNFFRFICYKSHKIIVYSNSAKKGLVEFYSVDRNKIKVMKLGMPQEVDYDNEKKIKFLKQFEGKQIILLFGLISPRKGHEIAIRSFHQVHMKIPNSILIIAGKINSEYLYYEKYLKNLVSDLELQDKVLFTGYLTELEISALFDSCQVVLYPYLPTSAGTASLMYALKHEKPTIVSDIDVFKEILDDESTKYVKTEDIHQLSIAIIEVCTDPKLQNNLKMKMKSKKNSFEWKKIADEHLKFYERVLNQNDSI